MSTNNDQSDNHQDAMLPEFREIMLLGWPKALRRSAKKFMTARQVEGMKWALRLRATLQAPARERISSQQAFAAENIDGELLDLDGAYAAELNRSRRYGPMSPLEAAQFWHYQYVIIGREPAFNPTLANGKSTLQEVAQDFAEDRKGSMDAIWAARQLADHLNVDYGDFIRVVIAEHLAGPCAAKRLSLRAFSTTKATRAVKAWLKTQV